MRKYRKVLELTVSFDNTILEIEIRMKITIWQQGVSCVAANKWVLHLKLNTINLANAC